MIRSALALLTILAAAPAHAEAFTYGASPAQVTYCDNLQDIMERAWDYREMNIKFHERTEVVEPVYTLIYIDSWNYNTKLESEGAEEKKWYREHWMKRARQTCLTGGYGA